MEKERRGAVYIDRMMYWLVTTRECPRGASYVIFMGISGCIIPCVVLPFFLFFFIFALRVCEWGWIKIYWYVQIWIFFLLFVDIFVIFTMYVNVSLVLFVLWRGRIWKDRTYRWGYFILRILLNIWVMLYCCLRNIVFNIFSSFE